MSERPRAPRLLAAASLLAAALSASPALAENAARDAAKPIQVLVAVPPLRAMVEWVGGDLVRVQALVRPGQDPHSFDLKPRQVAALARADLYLGTGMEFEAAWVPRLLQANARLTLLDARRGQRLLRWQNGGEDGAEHPGQGGAGEFSGADPHVWLSPLGAVAILEQVRDALARLDPANAARYAANCDAWTVRLRLLDGELRAMLAPLMRREFLVDHSSWRYFARDYQLREIALDGGAAGVAPRSLQRRLERARRLGLGTLYVHPSHNPRAALRLAAELGAKAVPADPLAVDYEDNLRRFARALMMH